MGFRSSVAAIGLFFLLFVASTVGMAQQSQSSGDSGALTIPLEDLIDQLSLRIFEAAAGDLSSCAGDQNCLKHAQQIQSWLCAAGTCDGTDKSKEPIACFGGFFDQYSIGDKEQTAASICSFIKSPSTATRQAVMSHVPDSKESELVEDGAYILALKGSAESCENYIKNYVGAYGPQWNNRWYRALSGCRILAHESTREQEEKDFYTWFGVARGLGNCSNIISSEMRNACNVPSATSPIPSGE